VLWLRWLVNRYLAAEAQVRIQAGPCRICSRQSDTKTGFSPNTSVFPCQYHSTHPHLSVGSTSRTNRRSPGTLLIKGKGKAVPLQAWTGPEDFRKLRFPDFARTAQNGGKVSLTHRPPLTPGNAWCSFLLEAESTPGAQCDRKDFMTMKNSNDTSWDRTSDLPICSAAS